MTSLPAKCPQLINYSLSVTNIKYSFVKTANNIWWHIHTFLYASNSKVQGLTTSSTGHYYTECKIRRSIGTNSVQLSLSHIYYNNYKNWHEEATIFFSNIIFLSLVWPSFDLLWVTFQGRPIICKKGFCTGLPRSMPNADQCRSKFWHWSQCRSIDRHWSALIGNDRHWETFRINAMILIGIDRHWALTGGVLIVNESPLTTIYMYNGWN